jgi:PilZ domain.
MVRFNDILFQNLPQNVIERRRFPRFVFHIVDPNYPYFLDNISKGGAKIVLPRNFNLNDEVLELKIPIYGEKKGRIVWKNLHKNKLEVGLEFIE